LKRLMDRKKCLLTIAALVLALASSCTVNRKPIISSLQGEMEWTEPLGSIRVICNASDPEGDLLSYSWSATGGSIVGTGAVVNWTAPAEVGMYDIAVVVKDSLNATATASTVLIASNGPPPVIHNLTVTADHKYLKQTARGYKVGKEQSYNITCDATGNGTLSYNWTCTGGSISGEGATINWTAPDAVTYITVTVKVFDVLLNWVRKSVFLEVVACSSCEFG